MKYISMIVLSIVAAMLPAFAQETVPYASRPPVVGDTYVPTLGDIMGATQLRHFKLWYAGKLRNWELASYELGQIEDSLINAARLYQNIPVEKINMIQQPLITLAGAIIRPTTARASLVPSPISPPPATSVTRRSMWALSRFRFRRRLHSATNHSYRRENDVHQLRTYLSARGVAEITFSTPQRDGESVPGPFRHSPQHRNSVASG
jgi:hypothetical protein